MKAIVGSWDTVPHKLLAELTALRTKVAQLKAEIDELQAENAMLREVQAGSLSVAENVLETPLDDKALASTSA
ncbi:hypothetical protein [Euzebya tangerina]|uniref:hypothetical protein n=1 Tax=Euzebya tangerina TaxID=591198 RepID=UPI000E323D88|nr:hypothetical protein [Euzebya tangerina]